MRVLLAHRYYHPDVTTEARTLRLLARRLSDDGHDVSVYASQPNYNDVYDGPVGPGTSVEGGVTVHRARIPGDTGYGRLRRVAHMLWFVVRFALHGLLARPAYDLVIVSTIPPIALPLACRLITAVRGGGYVIHGLDIYPELAHRAGMLEDGPVYRLLRRLDAANYRSASAAVVLSEDMRDTIAARGCDTDQVHVVNNMILADGVDPDQQLDGPLAPPDERMRVTFAGNLGRFQGLELILEAAARLADQPIQLAFMGDGKRRTALEHRAAQLPDGTVVFHDYQPLDVATRYVAQSHLALITLAPGVTGCAYPSKLMTTLKAGTRILAVVEQDSHLARLIGEHDLGISCPPGDVDALATALADEHDRWVRGGSDPERIRALGDQLFGRETILKRWSALVAELEANR